MMNNAQLATASLDDIVFDGRNRGYGAYELRALYQRHMTRALIIATALLALLLVFPVLSRLMQDPLTEVGPAQTKRTELVDVIFKEQPEVLPPPPAKPQPPTTQPVATAAALPTPAASIRYTVPKISTTAVTDVPEIDELAGKTISTSTIEGPPSTDPAAVAGPTSTGPAAAIGAPSAPAAPYTYVEQMPELPGGGGQAAIVAAIQRAARYPSLALRNGVEGKIFVSFVVNALGEVSDVKVVKGLGSGLDEETMRAVKSLPKFIPGKQNGQAVSVAFTVPISFKIQ
jgi:protein TonB